jgi:hypothetical protein
VSAPTVRVLCHRRGIVRKRWPVAEGVAVGPFVVVPNKYGLDAWGRWWPWMVIHRRSGLAATHATTEARAMQAAAEFHALPIRWHAIERLGRLLRHAYAQHGEAINRIRREAHAPDASAPPAAGTRVFPGFLP